MLKMTSAQLAPKPEPVKAPEPAKDAAPDLTPTIMALAQSVQDVAQIVADSARQNTAAIEQLAAQKDQRPTELEAVIRRDKDKLMTRIIIKVTK